MAVQADLLTVRKSLADICRVPDKIISVYSLEQHVWAESNSRIARQLREPELQTVREFQLDPVRPFLTDILRNMAAPYQPDRRDSPIGQGYWVQAEFGSGKSHLLCALAALALGSKEAWEIVKQKEEQAGRGRRESLYRFWEEGLADKGSNGKKGIFVIVKTLVGVGGGAVGLDDQGKNLSDYILDAAKEQIEVELEKNLSLYPAELLADRFIAQDVERYHNDLRKFLKDPSYFDESEFEDADDFIRDIQQNKSPAYKRSCGEKLWRFYTDYLKVRPDIEAEDEAILAYLVETILAEGYSGVLLVLDEVSGFMKDRSDAQRDRDEKTLVVLANCLAKVKNLPIWTICTAQQSLVSRMGAMNIIAEERLKLVKLLEEEKSYYDIVLARVREIIDAGAIGNYYLFYKRGFTWPNAIGEEEFRKFFPFHKPGIEVVRAVTYELTTARSAIHFMHQTLKHQVKVRGNELIRLWEMFDEAVRYEEDPSGVHPGLAAIETTRESDYRAYESCRQQLDSITRGSLHVNRAKAHRVLQTLFLYRIGRTRQQGLSPEEIANSVLIERAPDATPEENNQHYESLSENLKRELRQIAQSFDEDNRPRYRFDPVVTGVDPRAEFQKARDAVVANARLFQDAWDYLLAFDKWTVRIRQTTLDLTSGVQSMFRAYAPHPTSGQHSLFGHAADKTLDVLWQSRQITGLVEMTDLGKLARDHTPLTAIDSADTDRDFALFISTRPVPDANIEQLLGQCHDPRVLLWTPANLTTEEHDRVVDFGAYRKLIGDWEGKETEDAIAVVTWVRDAVANDLGRIMKAVTGSYARRRMDALHHGQLPFQVAGQIDAIAKPLVERVLTAAYESRDIKFPQNFVFRKEEAVKVINGIVKTGQIPEGARPDQNVSAAQNFGPGLLIVQPGHDRELDTSQNRFVQDLWDFIDSKLTGGETMKLETLYKNFMGVGGPKDYGLSRRMVQLYLLCLVRQGKVRVSAGPRTGLPNPTIDYATIAEIDFSARVLDGLADVQKLERPKNWEALRPYAGKLLDDEQIPATLDDAAIAGFRARLRQRFGTEADEAKRAQEAAERVFALLGTSNPYETELRHIAGLFATDLSTGDDIELLLFGLKQALGYQAFDRGSASQQEVDDLGVKLRDFRNLRNFLKYEPELKVGITYATYPLPDLPDLAGLRAAQQQLRDKLTGPQPYIDSDVRLKTELIGQHPPVAGERGTISALIHEYTSIYSAWHHSTLDQVGREQRAIAGLLKGDDRRAFGVLEGISALQPAIAAALGAQIHNLEVSLFTCDAASPDSIERQLRAQPEHACGFALAGAAGHVETAKRLAEEARTLLDQVFESKLAIFQSATVRARLEQGKSDGRIAALLACSGLGELRAFLVQACLADGALVDTINRYLKKIAVKTVKLADFTPSTRTIERGQINAVAAEFGDFLLAQLRSVEDGGDTLPMLNVE